MKRIELENRSMDSITLKRQQLAEAIATLPEEAVLEFANFLEYLRYKMSSVTLETDLKSPDKLGYSPNFFEETAGAWEGEPLTRGEQGNFDERQWGDL